MTMRPKSFDVDYRRGLPLFNPGGLGKIDHPVGTRAEVLSSTRQVQWSVSFHYVGMVCPDIDLFNVTTKHHCEAVGFTFSYLASI